MPILWLCLRAIPSLPATARWLGVAASLSVVPVVLYRAITHLMTNLGRHFTGDRAVAAGCESPLEDQTSSP